MTLATTILRFGGFGAILSVLAAPVYAGELQGLHPAEACVLQTVDDTLSVRMVDQLLAAAGLVAEPEPVGEEEADEIGFACVRLHGMPESDPRLFGNYAAGFALRDEARSRLNAHGYDFTWLDGVLATTRMSADDIADTIAVSIIQRMDRERRTNPNVDPDTALLVRGLASVYVYGRVAMMIAGEKLAR